MRLKAEKACNFNAIVWVLGEVNGYDTTIPFTLDVSAVDSA
jgi:hypothetical protein